MCINQIISPHPFWWARRYSRAPGTDTEGSHWQIDVKSGRCKPLRNIDLKDQILWSWEGKRGLWGMVNRRRVDGWRDLFWTKSRRSGRRGFRGVIMQPPSANTDSETNIEVVHNKHTGSIYFWWFASTQPTHEVDFYAQSALEGLPGCCQRLVQNTTQLLFILFNTTSCSTLFNSLQLWSCKSHQCRSNVKKL